MEATAETTKDIRNVWNTCLGHQAHPKGGMLFDIVKIPQADIAPIMGKRVRYVRSKLAHLLYARAYATYHPSITAVSIHSGVSANGTAPLAHISPAHAGRLVAPKVSAFNQQWYATASLGGGKRQVESGKFHEPIGVNVVPAYDGSNGKLAEQLWQWTEKELDACIVREEGEAAR